MAVSEKTRRSITLTPDGRDDLEIVKKDTRATTDNAAIEEAIHFRARLGNRRLTEIETALKLLDEARRQENEGANLEFVDRKNPNKRTLFLIPSFG